MFKENQGTVGIMDEGKIKAAVNHFRADQYWRDFYNNATSRECKRYIALIFYRSDYAEELKKNEWNRAEVNGEMEALEEEMDLTDWRYLREHAQDDEFIEKCEEFIYGLS